MAAGYLLLARVSQVFRGELPKELGARFYSFYFRVMQDQGIFFSPVVGKMYRQPPSGLITENQPIRGCCVIMDYLIFSCIQHVIHDTTRQYI